MNTTLRRTIATTLGHNLLVITALVVVGLFGVIGQEKESYARPAVVDSAAALVAEHDCRDQSDPTHAVVTVGGETRYVGQRLTDMAIEQAVFGVDHGLIVHAFCA